MTKVVAISALTLLLLTGCHSAYVEASVLNSTGGPVTLVEVDYPSASFGKDELAAGATYKYRFKILGTGDTKVLWTDAQHHDHSTAGPQLFEGQQGTINISLGQQRAEWQVKLQPAR